MSYVDVFGGSPVQPADVAERAIALSVDTVLSWPQQNEDSANVAARIMDVTPAANGLLLFMPPADQASNGQDALVRNMGSFSFTLVTATGATIVQITPGQAFYVYITDNTSASGVWASLLFGAGTSSVDAATLAGYGLMAISATLNAEYSVVEVAGDYTAQTSNRANLLVWTDGSGTITMPPSGTAGDGWFCAISNQGSGALSVAGNGSNVDGSSTVTLNPDESCFVICSGGAFYTVGRGQPPDFAITLLTKSVAGSSDVTLTASEAANIIQIYGGALTGDIDVIVPAVVQIYHVYNNTTGSYSLSVRTPLGTGVTVPQAKRRILHCDGTNVVFADDTSGGSGSPFSPGSAPAPSITFVGRLTDGIYSPLANQIGMSTNGVLRFLVANSGVTSSGSLTVSSGGASITGDSTITGNLTVTGTITGIPAPAIAQICAYAIALQ